MSAQFKHTGLKQWMGQTDILCVLNIAFPAQTALVNGTALPQEGKLYPRSLGCLLFHGQGRHSGAGVLQKGTCANSQKRRLQQKRGDGETPLHCLQVTPTGGCQHEGCSLEGWYLAVIV